jgi:hypothetical protein
MSMYVIFDINETSFILVVIINPSLVACIAEEIILKCKPVYGKSVLNKHFLWAVKTVKW